MDAEAYADMLPWLVFIVVNRKSGLSVTWAAGSAAVSSLVLLGWSYWKGSRASLPRIGLGVFCVCLVVALTVPAWNAAVGLPRAVMVGTLSLAALISLFATPLSEGYTTHLVAPQGCLDPRFRRVNVEITAAWAVGAALVAVACGTTALLADTYAFTFFGWVVPLALTGGTVLWTARRWELFRLAVDAHASASGGGARPVISLAAHDQGHPAAAQRPAARSADAVIRPFPLRRQRDA